MNQFYGFFRLHASKSGWKLRYREMQFSKNDPKQELWVIFTRIVFYTSSITAISAASPRRAPMRVMRV
jgi:hypothetical protein